MRSFLQGNEGERSIAGQRQNEKVQIHVGVDRSMVTSVWGRRGTYSYEAVVDTYLAEACMLRIFFSRTSSSGMSSASLKSSVMPGGSAENMGRGGDKRG